MADTPTQSSADEERIFKLVKHQLREARRTDATVTELMKPIKAELDAYAAEKVREFADSIYGNVTGAYIVSKNPDTELLLKKTEAVLNARLTHQGHKIKKEHNNE